MQARHGPAGKFVNHWPENLRWGTPAENMADKLRDGTHNRGERHSNAKLTAADVLECRRRYAAGGINQRALAAEFGVCVMTMNLAIRGQTWGHLNDLLPAS
jgi:hypothetical protein